MPSNRIFSSIGRLRSSTPFLKPHISAAVANTQLLQRMSNSTLEGKFEEMSSKVNSLKNDPGNEVKLKMYALFKQATQGVNTTSKPGALNFVAKAKWDAWTNLKDMSKDDAMKEYVNVVEGLISSESPSSEESKVAGSSSADSKFEYLLYEVKDGYCKITFNRPEKYNAINWKCYEEIGNALNEAAKDENVVVAALTGNGPYYSAGNDLSGFQQLAEEHGGDIYKAAAAAGVRLETFVDSFIQFPKPLIALVNGPAVGIPVTTLGLFDIVLASSNATFQTPFPSLGQSPEGCSSFTFPKLMGHAKAIELLLYEKKITAVEAMERNIVNEVIEQSDFQRIAQEKLEFYASLPRKSLLYSKGLMRDNQREKLMAVNKEECERLVERWTSEECINAIMKFLNRKQSKM